MNEPVLRVGILADEAVNNAVLEELVTWARSQPNLRIEHYFIHAPGPVTRPRSSPYARASNLLFRIVCKLERQLLKRTARFKDHYKTVDMRTVAQNVIELKPIMSGAFSMRFSDEDVQRVKDCQLDLLIRAGGSILRGGILGASRLGVLSFHHADNRVNRGMPAGYWEVYQRQDTTGFTLQRLTEELDGGDVLMRGHFPTRHYFLLNQAALYEKSMYYLKLLLSRVAATGQLPPPIPALPYSERLFRVPRVHESVIYLSGIVGAMVRKKVMKLLKREERWQVSFVPNNWRNAVLWRAETIPNPPGRYLADPFVIERDGKTYCFAEDYDCKTKLGRISVAELKKGASQVLGLVIDEPFHLSFPYLFEYQGQLYMCPECSQSETIRVYRCVEFPMRWELEKVIMKGVRAVDTMLFEKDGRWWMLTNIDTASTGDFCSDLFIFHSDSPLSEHWTPVPANPVVVDAALARNAGLLREGDKLFRVSQRQGFDCYGKGSQINEILTLTPEAYEEKCLVKIEPTFQDGLVGTHHMHSSGKTTVVDSLKSVRAD